MKNFTERLNNALADSGLTAADLARKSGINKGTISKYLHGGYIPKQSTIGILARALNVSPAWLLGFDVDKEVTIDLDKLTEHNKTKIIAYYEGLIASQEDENGNT